MPFPGPRLNLSQGNTPENMETRVFLRPMDFIAEFDILLDNNPPQVPINPPVDANYIFPAFHTPLAPKATIPFIDITSGTPMPYSIQQGYILEGYSFFSAFNTAYTIRDWFEIIPGTNIFTLINTFPASSRGYPFNIITQGFASTFSTELVDPSGASHKLLFTITNDSPDVPMIGDASFFVVIRKI